MSASAKVAYWQARCRELEAEIVKLSGKTFFCPQCEQYAKKIEDIKEFMRITKHFKRKNGRR